MRDKIIVSELKVRILSLISEVINGYLNSEDLEIIQDNIRHILHLVFHIFSQNKFLFITDLIISKIDTNKLSFSAFSENTKNI